MDYNKYFSSDVPSFLRSPVREIFRKVDLNAICSFAGGYPAADTFPTDQIPGLAARVLEKYGTKALQYGATQGVPELRQAIAERYGVPVSQVQITTSSQQGIDVCSRVLLNPGDIVLADSPVYLGALQSFKAYRAKVIGLDQVQVGAADQVQIRAVDQVQGIFGRGIISDAGPGPSSVPQNDLSGIVGGPGPRGKIGPRPKNSWTRSNMSEDNGEVKFIYVIPDFNNPTGKTLTLAEREALVQKAREMDVLIVEDSPYRELRYSGESLPTIRELAPERTLQLGSFSKVFAPGFRIGWIIGPEPLLEQIYICKQCLDLCPPVLDQYMACEFLTSGALDANLQKTIALYRSRRDLMLSLLEKYMPAEVSWTKPEGGLFLWLTFPEGIDTVALYDKALAAGVAYVAGSFFYVDGSHRNTMRLNFSFIDMEKMEKGIRLLADLVKGGPDIPSGDSLGPKGPRNDKSDVIKGPRNDKSDVISSANSVISSANSVIPSANSVIPGPTGNLPTLYRFTGAGNNFVVLDGRSGDVSAFRTTERIVELCSRFGTDGLMILTEADGYDFGMEFYNPDGSGGMMCGNGGRCIVAFASYLGLTPAAARHSRPDRESPAPWHFLAPDGPHTATILEADGNKWTVRLKMLDVKEVTPMLDGYFLNTGTRHFVRFVDDVDAVDVAAEGKALRWDPAFQPIGTNVNFVEKTPDLLKVRTFEKGVEGETLACGTGITASAIAATVHGAASVIPSEASVSQVRLQCRRGDFLTVDFTPVGPGYKDVYLTGPAELEKILDYD